MVVCKPAARETLTAKALTDWCRQHLAAYKVPRIIEFVESLPKSATGKLDWRALQSRQDGFDQADVPSVAHILEK